MARTPNETKARPIVAACENEGEPATGASARANPAGASNLDAESALHRHAGRSLNCWTCCRCSTVTWT